jgi:hypothetical protein
MDWIAIAHTHNGWDGGGPFRATDSLRGSTAIGWFLQVGSDERGWAVTHLFRFESESVVPCPLNVNG